MKLKDLIIVEEDDVGRRKPLLDLNKFLFGIF